MTLDQVNRIETALKSKPYESVNIRDFNSKEDKNTQQKTFSNNTSVLDHKQLPSQDAAKVIGYLREAILDKDSGVKSRAAKVLAQCAYHSDKNVRELAGKTLFEIFRGTKDGNRDSRSDSKVLSHREKIAPYVLEAMRDHDLNLSVLSREGKLADRLKEGPTPEFGLVAQWSVELLQSEGSRIAGVEPEQVLELTNRYISDQNYLSEFDDELFQEMMQIIDGKSKHHAPVDYTKIDQNQYIANVSRKSKKKHQNSNNSKLSHHHRTNALVLDRKLAPVKEEQPNSLVPQKTLDTSKINFTGNLDIVQPQVNSTEIKSTDKQDKAEPMPELGSHLTESTDVVETTPPVNHIEPEAPTLTPELRKENLLTGSMDLTPKQPVTENHVVAPRIEQSMDTKKSRTTDKTAPVFSTPEREPVLKKKTTEAVVMKGEYQRLHDDVEETAPKRKNAFTRTPDYTELEYSQSSDREDSTIQINTAPVEGKKKTSTGIFGRLRRMFG